MNENVLSLECSALGPSRSLNTQHATLIFLGFAEWTQPLPVHSSLFHRPDRPFLIRIIEPPAFPEVAGSSS